MKNINLAKFSDEELEEELKFRKMIEKNIPNVIHNPDCTKIEGYLSELIEDFKNGEYVNEKDMNVVIVEMIFDIFFDNPGKWYDLLNNQ